MIGSIMNRIKKSVNEARESERPLLIRYKGFQKQRPQQYCPVIEYEPGVKNPNYKSRPLPRV